MSETATPGDAPRVVVVVALKVFVMGPSSDVLRVASNAVVQALITDVEGLSTVPLVIGRDVFGAASVSHDPPCPKT